MRIGQNPAKYVKEVAQPARITVAVLNYIPFLSGYYAEMLDVLKACLGSIWEHSDLPYDLLVFDNGSCPEVLQWLADQRDAGRIQYLLLSEKNLGKGGAWNMILAGAPGEIIAYADNDVLFSKGWLSESVRVLETYPKTGMVTARPFRTKPEYFTSTLDWGRSTEGVTLEEGQLIQLEDFSSFEISLGNTEEQALERYNSTSDIQLSYQGVPAMAGASHWQFCAYKSVLQNFLPFRMDRPMGQVKQLDQRMNEEGFLRLMVAKPLAQNMSNTLSRGPAGTAAAHQAGQPSAGRKLGLAKRLARLPGIRGALLALHDLIFRLYYD